MNRRYTSEEYYEKCMLLRKYFAHPALTTDVIVGFPGETEEEFEKRLTFYKDHFWLMFEEEKLIAFVDGMVTNQEDLTDEMYEKAEMHDEKGDWQMIFGVNTLPSYRKHGYAGELIKRAITDAKEQGRKGLVLTCKDRLISYYARFGFKNEGVSESVHGNVVWNQMRLTFDEGLGE